MTGKRGNVIVSLISIVQMVWAVPGYVMIVVIRELRAYTGGTMALSPLMRNGTRISMGPFDVVR